MDLTDAQREAINEATAAFDSPEQFADALNSAKQPYYQAAYDRGHKDGLGQVNDERDRYKQKAKEAEQRAQKLESELEAVRDEQPDLKELRQSWEEEELKPLKEKTEQLRSRLSTTRQESELQEIEKRIRDKVANEWVAERLVKEARDRIDVSGDEATYLRPDGQTPYATAGDQDPRDLFANDLLGGIPDELRAPQKNSGPNYNGSGAAGQTPGLTKKQLNADKAKKAEFYAEQRANGNDPNEAFKQLPDN